MTITPITLPAGWTPFLPGSYPPPGAFVDVLHPDGAVTATAYHRQAGWLKLPPLFSTFDRPVVGWRPATGPFPRVPKEPTIKSGYAGWG